MFLAPEELASLARALRLNDRETLSGREFSSLAEKGKRFLLEAVSAEEERKMGIPWETAKHVLVYLGADTLFESSLIGEGPLKYVDPFHFCQWNSVMVPLPLMVPWWLQEAAGMVNNRFECDGCLKLNCLRRPSLALRSSNNAPFCRLVERKAADLVRIISLKGCTGEAVARWLLDPSAAKGTPPAVASIRGVVSELLSAGRAGQEHHRHLRAVEGLIYGLRAVLPFLRRTKYAPPGTERHFQGTPSSVLEFATRILETVLEALTAVRAVAEYKIGTREEAQRRAKELAEEVFNSLFLLASAFDGQRRLVLGVSEQLREFFAPLFVPKERPVRMGIQA